ncbi:glutathione S-transferase [Limnohabitans sp. Rim11]|uniref:glutathione S-transferase family protein n=1 Tax=Limnohabitans sp. Rim11 TaxID=1100719 RepID=UPI000AEB1861|nr:glutathione S-transferase [Limnohabitans sp. Rim11]
MLTLCGFGASNYYNKVKLVLLEKDIAFDEDLKWVGQVELDASPLGKVPYLKTDEGTLCESAVMVEYLEHKYSAHPLLPKDPFAAAKARELHIFLDLHLELVARELYAEAFFGGKVSDAVKEKVGKQLQKNVAAFAKVAKFEPFIGGSELTLADCAAAVNLPLVTAVSKTIYGNDFLADLPVKSYMKMWSERPSMQRVQADRKANNELFLARMQSKP